MNWSRLSRICLLGAVVMLVWLTVPAASCTIRGMDATPVGGLDEAASTPGQADVGRVGGGQGFIQRFFGNIGTCFAEHPLSAQEPWKRNLALGLGGGAVLFWLIGALTRPRYTVG